MNRLTYITRNYKGTGHGGGKARVDMEDILVKMGATNLGLKRSFHGNMIVDFVLTLSGVMKFMMKVRKGDIVVLQYPVKKYYRLICNIAHKKGAKVISLIHDLGCFRRRKLTVEEEMKKLALSDVLIVANKHTREWLTEHGCKVPMTEQIVWDYLSDEHPDDSEQKEISCLFVGDLQPSRNGYLYHLPESIEVNLYGNGCPHEVPANVINHGFTEADKVIKHSRGKYGLLWYGKSAVHDDSEFIGEYIRYCNSHKLALYMRAHKPVIIWSGAAAADFVLEHGVGITVDNMENIDKVLSEISPEEYNRMVENTKKISSLMGDGFYFSSALERAIELLD